MDRREFAGRALMAMLAGVTITMTGCGSENSAAPDPLPSVKLGNIANNHGHIVIVTSAQQVAGGAVAISMQGDSTHDHMLELTAAEVTSISRGVRVEKNCVTSRGHMHAVTFN